VPPTAPIAVKTSTPSPSNGLRRRTKAYDVVRWLGGHCTRNSPRTFTKKCAAQLTRTDCAKEKRRDCTRTSASKGQRWSGRRRLKRSIPGMPSERAVGQHPPDKPQNETKRAAYSNVADLMGRAAVHSGKVITWTKPWPPISSSVRNIDAMDYKTRRPSRPTPRGATRAGPRRLVGDRKLDRILHNVGRNRQPIRSVHPQKGIEMSFTTWLKSFFSHRGKALPSIAAEWRRQRSTTTPAPSPITPPRSRPPRSRPT